MFQRIFIITVGLSLSACASKQLQTSVSKLQSENDVLKAEIAKLQTQVTGLSNDLLIVQNRVESPAMPVKLPTPPAAVSIVAKDPAPTEAKKEYKPATFLSDHKGSGFFEEDIQFTDDEPSLKFTNKDLSNAPAQVLPGKNPSADPKTKLGNQNLETAPTVAAVPTTKAEAPNVEDPAIVAGYNRGYKSFKDQKYQDTISHMSEFLKSYPKHPYADNAIFWRGESYFQMKDYQKANAEFERVIHEFPKGNKVPDALLRSGICQLRLSKPDKAKKSFADLMKHYPESVAAKRAKATLGEL